MGPIYISDCSSVFCFNADVENGLLYRYDLDNFTILYKYLVDWNLNCNITMRTFQLKIERTAIQSLNWAVFLITRRRRGDRYTGGANVRLRLPYKYLRNFKTSKWKSASLQDSTSNYINSLMSVRLPLEGDEGMGFDMIYLTWCSLESSTICRVWDFVHNDVDRHPV